MRYFIDLTRDAGDPVVGGWIEERLVAGMLLRTPDSNGEWDPDTPLTRRYRSETDAAAWDRLDAFEAMIESNEPASDGSQYFLDMLAVSPDVHGQGVGRSMLEYVIGLCRDHPTASSVYLCTESQANHMFYEAHGFRAESSAALESVRSTRFVFHTG